MENQHRGGGVYLITCSESPSSYVGSSVRVRKRLQNHRCLLNQGKHGNCRLQRAWNKYGEGSFSAVLLEAVENVDDLLVREQHWMDSIEDKFNFHPVAGATRGVKRSAETIAKMSLAGKRQVIPPEQIAAMAAGNRGRTASTETRTKMSAAAKGVAKPPFSPTHRRAIGDGQRGKCRKFTKEHKEKLSVAALARAPLSQEVKDKISAANKGLTREFTDEHKAAIKAGWVLRKQRKQGIPTND